MIIQSLCCGAPIEQGSRSEYPLGGSVWSISIPVEICGECGKEADPVHQCGYCGRELNGDNPEIRTTDAECCHGCIMEVLRDKGLTALDELYRIEQKLSSLEEVTNGGKNVSLANLSDLGDWLRMDAPDLGRYIGDAKNEINTIRELLLAALTKDSEKESVAS